MRKSLFALPCLIVIAVAIAPVCITADEEIDFFEKKIRPVLVQHCYECHSADSKPLKGGLRVDSRPGLQRGGESGPAVVPGDVAKSALLKAVEYGGDFYDMPPKGKLPETILADLRKWVEIGAPDPRGDEPKAAATATWPEILSARRDWWSLQPAVDPPLPEVTRPEWSLEPIDRFVLASLDKAGLVPNPPVDRRTFIRRASLVLTGLPPTQQVIDEFLADPSPEAYSWLIDWYISSPHFGERFARHWMDVVRFTETHGNEWNYEVHHAWRYRDYLIRAFNEDVPYDQFVREHIAGDLLPQPRWNSAGFNESVLGTAFYRFGEVNHDDCITLPQIGYDLVDNQLDTLTKAFQGATVACARCHDHKLDAVSMQDYYALLGILRSSRLVAHTIDGPLVNEQPRKKLRDLKSQIRGELAAVWKRDLGQMKSYMLAADAARRNTPDAAALANGLDAPRLVKWLSAIRTEKPPPEHPLAPWMVLADIAPQGSEALKTAWTTAVTEWEQAERERREFNSANYIPFGEFARGDLAGWKADGHGLRDGPSKSGDFVVPDAVGAYVRAVLPAGWYTHALSSRLNGALRSPVLPDGKQRISLQVLGLRSSAVRLVSNNCQLNYANYKALTNEQLHWQTFSVPENRVSLRTFAELMTLLDNPKFPDQLSALGGDKDNYRLPWDKALGDGRSFFGVTRVVLHDVAEPPKAELGHLRRIFAGPAPASLNDLADRYVSGLSDTINRFFADQATDDDVVWLNYLLQSGLLKNSNDPADAPLQLLLAQYREIESREIETPRVSPGIADVDEGYNQPVFVRGECTRPGESTPRRYLEVLSRPEEPFQAHGSGRLELADRLASPGNPLTARVMVNRIWHHLFGAGLVRTVDDLGHLGDRPSHPELLDHLATRFVREGWSVKRLVRTIALSQTFRQGNVADALSRTVDPPNRLLSHYPARRLEAEAIRDCILATSGRLDRTLGGMSIQPFRDKEYPDRRLFPGPLDGDGRRSVYIKTNLMESARFLGAFNVPGGKVAQGRRDVSNVPAQALALLNDPFVIQQAGVWAERLVAMPDADAAARIDRMFAAALARPPTDEERVRFTQFVQQLADLSNTPPDAVMFSAAIWKDVAHAMLNVKEFIYVP